MEFVETVRGHRKVLLHGYLYVKQKELANGYISYECEKRRQNKDKQGACKAKIKVRGDEFILGENQHTHAPEPGRPEMLRVQARIKRRAADTEETPQQIITAQVQGLGQAAATQMPQVRSIRRQVRRVRRNNNQPPATPQNRATVEIPPEYARLTSGEGFLLHDTGVGDEQRILIFGTERTVNLLHAADHWYVDGTFKIVPELFFQLYTIHGSTNAGFIVPCLFALLPNKTRETYDRLFHYVKNLRLDMGPATVMMDYEKAAMNSVEATFPRAAVTGCFYHLSQSVYRKIQSEGLQNTYATDEAFALYAQMVPALAFVPVNDVITAFEALQDDAPAELTPILDYFEDSYVGRFRRRNRAQPLFAVETWNISNRVRDQLPRTNNHVEGFHRKMVAALTSYHPCLWKFLDVLRKEQALTNVILTKIDAGQEAPQQRRQDRATTQRLEAIMRDYGNRQPLDYLRGIAQNIRF